VFVKERVTLPPSQNVSGASAVTATDGFAPTFTVSELSHYTRLQQKP